MRVIKKYELNWRDFDNGIIKMSTDIINGYHCMDVKLEERSEKILDFPIKSTQIVFTLVKELGDEG